VAAPTSRRRGPAAPAGRPDPARRAVCDVLLAVDQRGAYANLLLPSILRERRLSGRDAALATELCYGTLRGQGTYDAILEMCSDRRVARMDPPVREALRLGVHQLLATRVATHAAVATSVDLAKQTAGARPAGFVNAVLRRVATRDLDDWMSVVAPDRLADPAGYLAVRHSYPRWVVTAFADALGEGAAGTVAASPKPVPAAAELAETGLAEAGLAGVRLPETVLAGTEAELAAGNVAPRVTLCATPGACEPGDLATVGEPARWSPFGVYLAEGDPSAVPAVRERRATVQDEASQLVALALARAGVGEQDRRWLDLCAGPGGKASLLAGLAAQRGARLVAADARPRRAGLARDMLAGPGGSHPAVLVADGTVPAWRPGAFDRVLADVPCCGLGSLRRRPESRWRRSPGQVAELAELQRSLLATALQAVRPGGVVGYATCSPHVAETREIVATALAGRPEFEVIDAPALLPEVPDLAEAAPFGSFAQFWTHRHGTDGMFLAVIRRLA